ncbi:MAG: type II toxin-antitoxin system RelE/ParE family toxin [Oscillospiraceae bacterium]|nr:type II toxin-antitoxin system RelE/ParE family toxin [Oscillospiraceae bacterium]
MTIQYSKDSLKYLAKMERSVAANIRAAIQGLTQSPPLGDIKVMQGFNDGTMRLRVGKYRIIYKYGKDGDVKVLYIIEIGTRGDIYK